MAFLTEFHERLSREKSLSPDRVAEILRREWGGQHVYVGMRDTSYRNTGGTVEELRRKYGIGRTTAFRYRGSR